MADWNRQSQFASASLLALIGAVIIPTSPVLAAANEFWLAPPDVTDLNDIPGGEPLYLHVVAGSAPSTVTVDLPANGSFVPIVASLPAFGRTRFNLTPFKSQLETRPTNTINNTGLHVTATTPVTATYEVANSTNAEIWALRGQDAPGQEFYIPLHKHAPFANEASYAAPHQAFASFDVVATQSNTQVTIYSPLPLDGHAALTQFTVTLNRGQTYSAAWTGVNWTLPSTHASGTALIADKPVVVSIKDDSLHNPSGSCQDLVGDQLVPVSALGREYIATKGTLNNTGDESLVVHATQNNTQIFLDGAATPAITLFAGEYYRVDLDYLSASANNAAYLRASKPIYATHYTGFGCEMAMALLPPIDRAGTRAVDVVRTDAFTFYLVLLAPSAAINDFTITGAGTATISSASFVTVPGTGGAWKAARIQYNLTQFPIDTPFRISNSSDRFIVGTLFGGASNSASYGYHSDFVAPTSLNLSMSRMPATLPEPGGIVTYTVHAQNGGVATMQLNSLIDSHAGDLNGQGCLLPQNIAASATYVCSFSGSVTGNGGDTISTTVTAMGTALTTSLSAVAASPVDISDVLPSTDVHNAATPTVVVPGGNVLFNVSVDNTGSAEAISLDTLIDDLHGNLNGLGSCNLTQSIPPGGSYACAYTTPVNGTLGTQVTNTLTASASDDETNVTTDQAAATVTLDTRIFADGFE